MRSIKPVYKGGFLTRGLEKPNYGAGYVGFSFRDNNIFSKGIAYFTREEYDGVVPSHSFIVTGEDELIESTLPNVKITPLHKYLDDQHVAVFFKKPRGLDEEKIATIIDALHVRLGAKYDYSLVGYFVFRTIIFRLLGRAPYFRKYPSIFDTPEEYLCSELVAEVLKEIPQYTNLLPLSEFHPSKISPLDLFRSDELFEEWQFDHSTST